MHETSALWKQIFEEPDHQKQIKATINGTGYDEGQIVSVSVSGRLFNAPGVGNAVSRTMKMELIPHSGARGAIPPLSEIRLFARLVSADGERVSEYIPKGVFYADTVVKDTDTGTATITAFDALTKAELPFDPTASGGQSGGTTRTCTVSFNDGYGNVQKFHPRIGDPMPTPTTPTHEDERFLSWNPNPAATPTVRRDMLFMASWERKFTVTFESGDETPQTFFCFAGEATPTPETPTKDGYSFHEWLPTPAATVTEDVTYTAQWAGMTSAAITAYPVKSDYFTGETLDYAGLTVTATYSDGATRDITSECALRPAEGTEVIEAGDIMVDVRYQDKSLGTFWVAVTKNWWTLYENGLLDIYCVGNMPNFSYIENSPWHEYALQINRVTIRNSVTSIGDVAFDGCISLTSVTIPDSVTSIGDSAFGYCEALQSVTIPDSVTSIGDYAFYNCKGLTSVTIPNSVTSIGKIAFSLCTSLTSLKIPSSVTSIGYSAFYGCSSLTSVTAPDPVNGNYDFDSVFNSTNNLTNFTISSGAVSVPDRAFATCRSFLGTITIPDGITSIGFRAFSGCKIASVMIPNSVTSIGDFAFSTCRRLENAIIPDSVTSIGNSTFWSSDALRSVTIGDGVTSIGEEVFYNCLSLTSVTIPDSVTSIGDSAFGYCEALQSVTIPDSVTSIGDDAFWRTSLSSVTINRNATVGTTAFPSGCVINYY